MHSLIAGERRLVKIFRETEYSTNPQMFYKKILEKTREWEGDRSQLKQIMNELASKFSHEVDFFEKTSLFLDALMNNSSELH